LFSFVPKLVLKNTGESDCWFVFFAVRIFLLRKGSGGRAQNALGLNSQQMAAQLTCLTFLFFSFRYAMRHWLQKYGTY